MVTAFLKALSISFAGSIILGYTVLFFFSLTNSLPIPSSTSWAGKLSIKGQIVNILGCRPDSLYCQLLSSFYAAQKVARDCKNKCVWLCSNKTLFRKSSGTGSSLLTPGLEAQVLVLASSLTHSDLLRYSFTRLLYHLVR